MNIKIIFCSFFVFPLLQNNILCLVVGSESAVSIESFVEFPGSDSDNTILGFAKMDEGFALQNYLTSCTYNALYPVTGLINLKGGTLYLQRDLAFDGLSSIESIGNISGQGNIIDFSTTMTKLIFDKGVPVPDLVFQQENNASIYTLDWSFDGKYLAVGFEDDPDVFPYMLRVYYFDGLTLTLTGSWDMDAGGFDRIECVRWHPSLYFLATGKQDGSAGGFDLATFKFTPEIGEFSNVFQLEDTTKRSLSWDPAGNFLIVQGYSITEIQIFSFDSGTGVLSVVDTVDRSPNRNPYGNNCIKWSPGSDYFAVGFLKSTTGGENELDIYYFDGATITDTGLGANLDLHVSAIDWSPTGSFIAVGIGSSGVSRLRVYEHRVWNGTLVEIFALSDLDFRPRSIQWSEDGNRLLVSSLTVSGDTEVRLYNFDKATGTLTLLRELEMSTYQWDIRWTPNNDFFATGGMTGLISVYTDLRPEACLEDLTIRLAADLELSTTLQIKGLCTIDGGNRKLIFGSDGILSLQPSSTLKLKNLNLEGLGSNIRCLTEDCSIEIENVKIAFSQDFTQTMGSLMFSGDNFISGTSQFVLGNSRANTLASNSRIEIGSGVTFSYDPLIPNQNLFFLTDETSQLYLNDCTFYVTKTGLNLSNGKLMINGNTRFSGEGMIPSEGIYFNDDLSVDIGPAANIELVSGYLTIIE
ncbi:hypothetical protein KAW80_03670 [Candidatus Babeliales bacterium]|nr:hypothetical protein [Candidatus Babeliales bacterium]